MAWALGSVEHWGHLCCSPHGKALFYDQDHRIECKAPHAPCVLRWSPSWAWKAYLHSNGQTRRCQNWNPGNPGTRVPMKFSRPKEVKENKTGTRWIQCVYVRDLLLGQSKSLVIRSKWSITPGLELGFCRKCGLNTNKGYRSLDIQQMLNAIHLFVFHL